MSCGLRNQCNQEYCHRCELDENGRTMFVQSEKYTLGYEQGRADAIDSIVQAEKNKYFCIEDLCTGAKDCSDCRVEYLEKLKEKDNG